MTPAVSPGPWHDGSAGLSAFDVRVGQPSSNLTPAEMTARHPADCPKCAAYRAELAALRAAHPTDPNGAQT